MTDTILTAEQARVADKLLRARPPVVPGTRAIVNRTLCDMWFSMVTAAMEKYGVTDARAVAAFCDRAGVPD